MAETDFTLLSGSLPENQARRGVTGGVARPPTSGTNNFILGVNAIAPVTGVVAWHRNDNPDPGDPPFAPALGSSAVEAVIQRQGAGGGTFVFASAGSASVGARAYVLGLSSSSPSRLVLRKADTSYTPGGGISDGVPDMPPDPTQNGVLLRSTSTYALGTWVHVRLEVVVNGNDDVWVRALVNDLTEHPLGTAPSWEIPPGMEGPFYPAVSGFCDDGLAVNTGTVPYTSGFMGLGVHVTGMGRRGYFDNSRFEVGETL
jgi:hypothetical protein